MMFDIYINKISVSFVFLNGTAGLAVLPGVPHHLALLVHLQENIKERPLSLSLYLSGAPGRSVLRADVSALVMDLGLVAEWEDAGLVEGGQTF